MKKTGSNKNSMQAQNRSLILQILLHRGTCTRVELTKLTGLTQAAITKIVGELIESNFICEGSTVKGSHGSRTIELYLNNDLCKVVGVKLSRREIQVAVFRPNGEKIVGVSVAIHAIDTPEFVLNEIKRIVHGYIDQFPDICAIGMAVPGPYLRKVGRIAVMSEFTGWQEIDIRREMETEFDIPVVIEHDAKAGAFAEWTYSGTEGNGTLISLLLSDGVGAGVVVDGALLRGADGTAGEVGHVSINMTGPRCTCGNRGCLELYTSSIGFVNSVREGLIVRPESSLNNIEKARLNDVFQHMKDGDAYAIEKVRQVSAYIGVGLANMVYMYNPNEIVITGTMVGGGDLMMKEVKAMVEERVLPELRENLTIRFSTLEHDSILMGAAALATQDIFQNPRAMYKTK